METQVEVKIGTYREKESTERCGVRSIPGTYDAMVVFVTENGRPTPHRLRVELNGSQNGRIVQMTYVFLLDMVENLEAEGKLIVTHRRFLREQFQWDDLYLE